MDILDKFLSVTDEVDPLDSWSNGEVTSSRYYTVSGALDPKGLFSEQIFCETAATPPCGRGDHNYGHIQLIIPMFNWTGYRR